MRGASRSSGDLKLRELFQDPLKAVTIPGAVAEFTSTGDGGSGRIAALMTPLALFGALRVGR